ncbi:Rho GTPase activation protein (RhoGAP) with PH domain-containing protein [Actinidia rufa]|uniref:Rho GTPase activation protein (RhoGAP) with PH domain-containing protein n=1 Tax=Actinidia rufa TaxID=165716 RepID=A0A7J0HCC7_9ERIC|nr:Rho GTPase activation protein (RhoGAP) with PH domain-containing protein [Actinidia rufa]
MFFCHFEQLLFVKLGQRMKYATSALPQRGGEVNITLGGIDLNNSGSVVVLEDKKLLTVLFPDGRDGRAFTLKAETSEDLYEWKTALEHALAQAPSAALVMGHNGIFRNDSNETIEGSFHQWRDKRPIKSLVVGRPILLALEDIDGGPSFLEKALRFLEKYGTKVEGILRQAADVEEVDRRVQEYEQGKNEFDPDEDAHVVGDCIKHVLRELPSSPVPASCCTALLEAYKIDRKEARVNAMRSAILETFPEPNRRLLQRILKMMHTISLHESENRMNQSAVAACMAPLLLRPLLAGECELEDDFDFNGDNSAQLLAAANAANNAQAIITTLLEEMIIYIDARFQLILGIGNSGSENSTDDENLDMRDNGYHDAENEKYPDTDDDPDRQIQPVDSESVREPNIQLNEEQVQQKRSENDMDSPSILTSNDVYRSMGEILSSMNKGLPQSVVGAESCGEKSMNKLTSSAVNVKRSTLWGRSTQNIRIRDTIGLRFAIDRRLGKSPSVESIDSSGEEELAIQKLEITKNDLRHRIAKEARGNAILQASLERRKQALHERRLALEQDVSRLQEQLQAERDLRAALEVGLSMSSGQFSSSRGMDSKTRAELEEIALAEADVARLKQKVAELHHQLNQQRQHHYGSLSDACDHYQHVQNNNTQQKYFQQDFDMTLAFVNHERKQRTEESILGAELRNIKGQVLTSGSSSRQPARKHFGESASFSDSKSTEASTSISVDDLCAVDSASIPSTSRVAEALDYARHPSTASSTLVELTTRLDFFKERRSQLMEQLHNLDLNYGTTSSQDFAYKPSSPSWN